MTINAAGFARPTVVRPITREAASILSKTCPAIRVENSREIAPDATSHPIWGPVVSTNVGWAIDREVRHKGSSGGVISGLALFLLESGAVDGVVQTCEDPQQPLLNITQVSRNRAAVINSAGSRYSPASPLRSLSEWASTGQRLAFVGKPCDVAALRQLIRAQPSLGARFPYLLSFMCAGTPSFNAGRKLLEQMGAEAEKVVAFRYRGDGWPGMAKAEYRDGTMFEWTYERAWGGVLGKDLQFRCKICADGTGEFADITCADAWSTPGGYPDFEERDGRSLLIARTAAGQSLLLKAARAGYIHTEALDIGEVAPMQPYQVQRKQNVLGRLAGTWLRLRLIPAYRRLGLLRASMSANKFTWLRQAVGTFRRAEGERQ